MIKLLITTTLVIAISHAQFEEYKSTPVKAYPSNICANVYENKPKITVRPDPSYTFRLGRPAKIVCAASGMPTPYVYWIKGKKDLTNKEERIRVTAVGEAVLFFDRLTANDVDMYTCVVEDCCRGSIQRIETEIKVDNAHTCNKRDPPYGFFVVVWEFTPWWSAKKWCEDKNMQLAVPKNEKENKDLHTRIVESQGKDPNGKKFAHHNMVWMGMSDSRLEGGFIDVYTHRTLSYRNWMSKQPDNWTKYDKVGQDVVAMDRITGQWDDSYGFWKRPFACYCPPRWQRKN